MASLEPGAHGDTLPFRQIVHEPDPSALLDEDVGAVSRTNPSKGSEPEGSSPAAPEGRGTSGEASGAAPPPRPRPRRALR